MYIRIHTVYVYVYVFTYMHTTTHCNTLYHAAMHLSKAVCTYLYAHEQKPLMFLF